MPPVFFFNLQFLKFGPDYQTSILQTHKTTPTPHTDASVNKEYLSNNTEIVCQKRIIANTINDYV